MAKSRALLAALVTVSLWAAATSALAAGARRADLEQSLGQRYGLTQIGPGVLGLTGGRDAIQQAGGVVLLQSTGLYGALDPDQPASFAIREGNLSMFRGHKDYAFPLGERLYVHSVYVGSDVVVLGLLTARSITTPAGTGRLWASCSFFFSPETLANADTGTVLQVLDQWLIPEEQSRMRGMVAETMAAQQPAPPATPAELETGMTRAQVVEALGPPLREVSFGTRTWLTYSGLVALLEDGTLSAVDRSGQPPAKLTISSEPDAADIYVDGSFVGSTPATLHLPAGTYEVSVRLSGYQDWQRNLRVLAGSEITLRSRLEGE